jgi:RNA recognition motif-containing protein
MIKQVDLEERMKSIFVGNISFIVTENDILSLFKSYGAVRRVCLIADREMNRHKGIAFVDMVNDTEAAKAINALNGHKWFGRELRIKVARRALDKPSKTGSNTTVSRNRNTHNGRSPVVPPLANAQQENL